MTDYREHFIDTADGLRVYCRDYPGPVGAPTVLCLHGLTRNSADFARVAEHLSAQYRVLCPDQRGRGLSSYDAEPANYQPATYVSDMLTLLDTLDIDQVIVVGTSMGGLMGMIMGAMQPHRIRALVLNDIGPEVDPAGLARIKSYAGKLPAVANWAEAVAQVREINADVFPDFSDAQWLEFARGLYREGDDGVPVLAYDPAIAKPIDEQEEAAVPPDLWPMFESLAMPVLVIRGATSDILAASCAAAMVQRGAACEWLDIPGRGHAPMLDEPTARAALDRFLARH